MDTVLFCFVLFCFVLFCFVLSVMYVYWTWFVLIKCLQSFGRLGFGLGCRMSWPPWNCGFLDCCPSIWLSFPNAVFLFSGLLMGWSGLDAVCATLWLLLGLSDSKDVVCLRDRSSTHFAHASCVPPLN